MWAFQKLKRIAAVEGCHMISSPRMIRRLAAVRAPARLRASSDTANLIASETEVTVLQQCGNLRLRLITPSCTLYDAPLKPAEFPFQSLPFWGFLWPGGYGIAHYLASVCTSQYTHVLDVGSGCGICGLAAAFSSCLSASSKMPDSSQILATNRKPEVIFNDVDADALVASQLNWELNTEALGKDGSLTTTAHKLKSPILCGDDLLRIYDDTDLLARLSSTCSSPRNLGSLSSWLVTAGDIAYDDDMSHDMLTMLYRCKRLGATVLVGDPGRLSFQRVTTQQPSVEGGQNWFRRIHSTPICPPVFQDDDSHTIASVMQLE